MKNELKHVTFTGAVEAFKCSGDKDSLPLGNEQMLFIVFKSNVVKLVNITSHKTWLTYSLSAPILSFSHFWNGFILPLDMATINDQKKKLCLGLKEAVLLKRCKNSSYILN